MVAAFVLVFIAPPLVLAFLGGAVFPTRWAAAGVGSLLILAALLMATSSHGIIEMAPFIGLVGAILLLPVILAAFVRAKFRRDLKKES